MAEEEKEKFFLAVMFSIGPPPVDNTRQGTWVGAKGASSQANFTQRHIFRSRMLDLMTQLGIPPFAFRTGAAEDLFRDYVEWYDTQHALRRARGKL